MIATAAEYTLTKSKLASVRDTLARIEQRPGALTPARAASLRSIRAYANQLVEELIRYEAAQGIVPRTETRSALAGR